MVNTIILYSAIILIGILVVFFVYQYFTCSGSGSSCSSSFGKGANDPSRIIMFGGILVLFIILIVIIITINVLPTGPKLAPKPDVLISFPIGNDTRYLKERDTFGISAGFNPSDPSNGNTFRDVFTAELKNGNKAFWSTQDARPYCKPSFYGTNCDTESYVNSYTAVGNLSGQLNGLSLLRTVQVDRLSIKLNDSDTTCTTECDTEVSCWAISYIRNDTGLSSCSLLGPLILSYAQDNYDYSLITAPVYYIKSKYQFAPFINDRVFFHDGTTLPLRYWLKDISPLENVESMYDSGDDYIIIKKLNYLIVDLDRIPNSVGDVQVYISKFFLTADDITNFRESTDSFMMDKAYRLSFPNPKLVPFKYSTLDWTIQYAKTILKF